MSGKGKKDAKGKGEDCSCYADSRTAKTCPPVRNVTHPLRYYEFTQEEIKALEECDKESFYQRCLPFSALFGTATYAAIKYGLLSRNPHFGATPKVCMAALAGHLCGRAAHVPACERKLRALPPHSELGNIMRKHHADNNPPPDPEKR